MKAVSTALALVAVTLSACAAPKGNLASDLPPPVPAGDPNAASVEASDPVEADEPAPAAHPDALEAAPDHYKLVAESDSVRLLLATWQPGESDAMHSHPDQFAYVLTDGSLSVEGADGTRTELVLKAGEAIPSGAQTGHRVTNTGEQEVRVLILERSVAGSHPVPDGAAGDALSVSPDHYTLVGDSDWVRLLRANWEPGTGDKMHSHPDSMVYLLTDATVDVENQSDKSVNRFEGVAGDALEQAAAKGHAVKNAGKQRVDVLIFELK